MQSKKQIKIDPFNNKRKVLEGSREEILNALKNNAKPSCSKCFGRGYLGYKENKESGSRVYIPCYKCADDKINIKQ